MEPVAVGAGSTYALQLMSPHWPFKSMAETAVLASYVIYRFKKGVESCGEYTDIACMKFPRGARKAEIELISPQKTKLLETQFDRFQMLHGHVLD